MLGLSLHVYNYFARRLFQWNLIPFIRYRVRCITAVICDRTLIIISLCLLQFNCLSILFKFFTMQFLYSGMASNVLNTTRRIFTMGQASWSFQLLHLIDSTKSGEPGESDFFSNIQWSTHMQSPELGCQGELLGFLLKTNAIHRRQWSLFIGNLQNLNPYCLLYVCYDSLQAHMW